MCKRIARGDAARPRLAPEGGSYAAPPSARAMCRLFGMLGGPATPAEPWLVSTDRSLLHQSNANAAMLQSDGWGIAWYPETRAPRIVKGVGGAYQDGERERYVSAARRAHGPVVLGHLRHASNPMGLPRERLIGPENSQPFEWGGCLFAHNGSIPHPSETRPLLGKFEEKLRGVNDSEVLFFLLVHHVEVLGDPLAAYAQTVSDLARVGKEHGKPSQLPYSGLNVLFSRGPNELWAFCHWQGEHGRALADPRRPYYEMTFTTDTKQLVVGSEPFDASGSEWHDLPNGHYLFAHVQHGLVATKTGPIPSLPAAPAHDARVSPD